MMVVLDASMSLAFVLQDEFIGSTPAVLEYVARNGALVPALWEVEVLNGLRSAELRGRLSEAGASHALQAFASLPIDISARRVDRVHVLSIARDHGLSAYDATYLWLAMAENLSLATRDGQLAHAARTAGVEVLGES